MDMPEQTKHVHQQPRAALVLRLKSFSETSIGAVPGAMANAIYNACGVRIREHPITREEIMAGSEGAESEGRAKRMKNCIGLPTHEHRRSHPDPVRHGTESGVYAGGTDLLIRLKNRLKQAPTYLVDIKKINDLRYIKEDAQGNVQIGALTKLAEMADSRHHQEEVSDAGEGRRQDLVAGTAKRLDGRRRHAAGSLVPVPARRLLLLSQRRLHLLRSDRRQQLLPLGDGRTALLCGLSGRYRDGDDPVRREGEAGDAVREQRNDASSSWCRAT